MRRRDADRGYVARCSAAPRRMSGAALLVGAHTGRLSCSLAAMQLGQVLTTLDRLAPLRYAESWDNVGLLVGDPRAEIHCVLVTVDYTSAVAA